jgi:putative endonuclease
MRRAGNGTVGSNPTLSAILLRPAGLRRIGTRFAAKQDALRSFSEGGCHMFYVYLLESLAVRGQRYVGMTVDLKLRLRRHNAGQSRHTSKFRPWRLITYLAFSDRTKAESFERYLKSGSGHAFANKRLW